MVVAALALLGSVSRLSYAAQDAAKRYFQNGVDLITAEQPNYQDAYYQFQLAYQESGKSWKVLGNLGLCALKLERDQEAAAYYEQYLDQGGNDIAREERTAIEQDLLLLKGNLATVVLTSKIAELKIIDRRAGSQAPAQPYTLVNGKLELQLRAGNHTLTATNGEKRLNWEVVLEPKSQSAHEFDFDAPVAAPAVTPAAPTGGADRSPRRGGTDLRVPGFISLAAGAVAGGIGGYFMWQRSDYNSQADDAFACNRLPIGCSLGQRATVRDLEENASAATTRAVVSFGVSGAAIITGVILIAVSSPGSNHEAQVTPWIGYGSAGVSGRF